LAGCLNVTICDSVTSMALIVFLRGVNVGGHRTFRASILARELSDFDGVNVGAAGTFIVRKPESRGKFRAELLRKLPFAAEVVLCDGRDLIRLETENPFGTEPSRPDIVRFSFHSILSLRSSSDSANQPTVIPYHFTGTNTVGSSRTWTAQSECTVMTITAR